MGFLDVAYLASRGGSGVVEVKASGPPHVLKVWLEASNGMLPVEYFRSNKTSFCIS